MPAAVAPSGRADNPSVAALPDLSGIDEIHARLPFLRSRLTQVGRGLLRTRAQIVSAAGVHAMTTRIESEIVWDVRIERDLIAFILPIMWRGELAYNGWEAVPDGLFVFTRADGVLSRSADRSVVSVALDHDEFVRALAACEGVSPEEARPAPGLHLLPPGALAPHRQRLAALVRAGAESPESLSDPAAAEDFARTVSNMVLDICLAARSARRDREPRRPREPSRIVRCAEERFMDAIGRNVSLADLCRATGVGAKTLTAAFQAVTGLTPMRYFKLRRLAVAHELLRHAPPQHGAVKQAALGAGLTELGRFAVEYRHIYGESPSATLNRLA